MRLIDLLFGRLVRLDGPTLTFTDLPKTTGTSPSPVPAPVGPDISAPGPAGTPHLDDSWPVGRGRHASNCLFLDDPRHACLNSYGDPIRPGQACFSSARAESLKSFVVKHPSLSEILS